MKKRPKIMAFFLFVFNLFFVWIFVQMADLFVSLGRLSELTGYRLTDDEEMLYFRFFTVLMLFIQALLLYFISRYLHKHHVPKAIVFLNALAYCLLFVAFVYIVYDFTIIDY